MMTQSYLPDSTSIPPDSALRDIHVEFKRSWFMSTMRSVTQSCLTLCNPTDCSWPGSSVHEILQARKLEWVAISFSNA